MDKLSLFIPITKVDVAQRLVYGLATAEKPDAAKEVCDYDTTKPFYEKWSEGFSKITDGKSLGNVRAMHGKVAAGKLTQIAFNDGEKQIEICAKVVDDDEWNKVQEGVYTGFSQGGRYVKRWKDGEVMKYTADPSEVSLVDLPCLDVSTFSVIKADGTSELRKFKSPDPAPEREPTMADVGARAVELAKAAGSESKWWKFIDQAHGELTKALNEPNPPEPVTPPASAAAAARPVDSASEVGKQVWVHDRLPGQSFAKRADLRMALLALDAGEAAHKAAAPVLDALKKITDRLGGGTVSLAADMDKMAAVAALSTPSSTAAPLHKNWEEWNDQHKNDSHSEHAAGADKHYAAAERERAAGNTAMAAAHQTIAGWHAQAFMAGSTAKTTRTGDLAKRDFTDDERKNYAKQGVALKDGSYPIPDKDALKDAVSAFGRAKNKAATKRHITRRAKTLGATDELPAEWPGSTKDTADKAAFADELKKGGAVNLYNISNLVSLLASVDSAEEGLEAPYGYGSTVPKELCDRFGAVLVELGDIVADLLDLILNDMRGEEANEAMERGRKVVDLMKAGARHSKGDRDMIQAIHDHAAKLGADCADDASKAAGGEVDDLNKQLAAKDEAFTKTLGAIAETVADIAKRVVNIENQPVPSGPQRYHVAEKANDSAALAAASTLMDQPGVLDSLAEIAIRKAHTTPMRAVPGLRPPGQQG